MTIAMPRVLIVCEHASLKFGGEAALPIHYFSILRKLKVDAWLITHARTKDEVAELFPNELDRIHFVSDSFINKLAWKAGRYLPDQISYVTLGYVSRIATQLEARRMARKLIVEADIDIVHQPIPVSPREPSLLHGMGVPVIIGPMNGNMTYPSGFQGSVKGKGLIGRLLAAGRSCAELLHVVMPGKLLAAGLLVANDRTRRALPRSTKAEVITLVENGVDLSLWVPKLKGTEIKTEIKFIFMGRLVDWKAVDIIIEAFSVSAAGEYSTLEIIGDGPMRPHLEALTQRLGLQRKIKFTGWIPQRECSAKVSAADIFLLPSIYECGGAVVLEAMACELPVIATDWGGPSDYVDRSCGVLIKPDSRENLIGGFAEAMTLLAGDAGMRAAMGAAGRERVRLHFDWDAKVHQAIEIYRRFQRAPQRVAATFALSED